jgi:hypothetical protein
MPLSETQARLPVFAQAQEEAEIVDLRAERANIRDLLAVRDDSADATLKALRAKMFHSTQAR